MILVGIFIFAAIGLGFSVQGIMGFLSPLNPLGFSWQIVLALAYLALLLRWDWSRVMLIIYKGIMLIVMFHGFAKLYSEYGSQGIGMFVGELSPAKKFIMAEHILFIVYMLLPEVKRRFKKV